MPRDLEAELDLLGSRLDALEGKFANHLNPVHGPDEPGQQGSRPLNDRPLVSGRVTGLRGAHPGLSGCISYYGYYESDQGDATQDYSWDMSHTVDALLDMDDEAVASVLAALGSKQRLAILKAILKAPSTAAQLVDRLGLGTTGQVYHHLKALQAADLITQEGRGTFVFKGHRVQGLLMLLVGVADALDGRYSKGTWVERGKD